MNGKPVDLTDPDNPEWTEEDFARARPAAEVLSPETLALFGKRRGRPPAVAPKVAVSLRLDAEVVEAWRATGAGWQSRINAALKSAAPKLKA